MESISALPLTTTTLIWVEFLGLLLGAMTKMSRLVQLDRGVPLQIVHSSLREGVGGQSNLCVCAGRENERTD